MDKELKLTELADKHYIIRMLIGLLVEIIEDMKYLKDNTDGYGFALRVRQLVTTVRMLEEIME